jgi:RNA polymerase sigma-70 factor (ECF subfamily)
MDESSQDQVTRLLSEAAEGRERAADELLPLVYDQLKRLAQKQMANERAGHTLQATALVHEAYVRLVGAEDPGWSNRAHFYVAASQAIRRILIDHARARGRKKRGGGAPRQRIRAEDLVHLSDPDEILDLDAAVDRLEVFDPDMARVVQLRFFGGLSIEETAKTLGVSASTVKRDWTLARAWLYKELACADSEVE